MLETSNYPSGRLLMGPGPSGVHPRVLEALSIPIVGHLDPQFLAVMDRIQEMLRRLFRTENRLTIAVSGTGSSGMESAFVNVVEPGDEVLVCVNGVFGNRMSDIVERIGGVLHRIDRPWGEVFEPTEIEEAIQEVRGGQYTQGGFVDWVVQHDESEKLIEMMQNNNLLKVNMIQTTFGAALKEKKQALTEYNMLYNVLMRSDPKAPGRQTPTGVSTAPRPTTPLFNPPPIRRNPN